MSNYTINDYLIANMQYRLLCIEVCIMGAGVPNIDYYI